MVLDEVHERTLDSDLSLLLMKLLMVQRSKLRLVIMSATMDAALFCDYFLQFAPNLQPLMVGGSRFHCKTLYLDKFTEEWPALSHHPAYKKVDLLLHTSTAPNSVLVVC